MKQSIKFWKTFYKIRYYPSISDKQTINEIRFVKEFLPKDKYKNILDFVCGFGRHSIELAKNDYNVEGFDIDEESIRSAKNRIKSLKLENIKLYKKDALRFGKKEAFDAAICLYSSIGFLDEKTNNKIFKNLFQSVEKGGRIIFDVMNAEWAIKYLKPYSEKEVIYKRRSYLIKHKRTILYNPIREKNIIKFLDKKSLSKYKTSYKLRLYSFKELKNKFQENNFKVYEKFGSFNKNSVSANHQRIILIADKLES